MLVSIVIPTYNRWPTVAETVASALNQQTRRPFEVIVVDDGSTDGSGDELERAFPAARVVRRPNQERGASRNAGASVSGGEFLSFIDSDDLVDPWHVDELGRAVDGDASAPDVVYSAPVRVWDPDTDATYLVAPSRQTRRSLATAVLTGNRIPLPGLFIPRARFDAAGRFPEEREIARTVDFLGEVYGERPRDWVMCYPFGAHDATTLDVVGAAGCVVGLTTHVGVARDLAQPLTLPRLDTNDLPRRGDASPAALEAQRG